MSTYDFVIVGAGSSGSALAGRLATNNNTKILLLEAGPKDYNPYIKLPIGYGKLFYDQSVNWKFYTEPEENLNGKKMYWPRGKVLGGSSSINAMSDAETIENFICGKVISLKARNLLAPSDRATFSWFIS